MRKYGKKVLTFGLVCAMTASLVPVSGAAKPELNVKAKTIAVGDKTTLTVKNKPKKATYRWTSSDKKIAVVNKKGVVTGKSNGVTTITCSVKTRNTTKELVAKIHVLQLKKVTKVKNFTAGEKITLSVQKYKNAKYTWTSNNKKVATVNEKGIVTGVNAGEATIRCKVKSPEKSYIAQYKVKVNTTKKVVTQVQLDSALKNKKITDLTIAPKSNIDLTIPTGDYSKVNLVVDAPNADITNNGVFKTIKIKNIKANTWYENAKGNRIGVYAKDSRIVIGKESSVDAMSFMTKGATATVQVEGVIKELKVKKENSISVTANGTVGKISVDAPSNIKLDGTTKEGIKVEIEKEAEGAKLDSAVKVSVETSAKVNLILQKGSEGSDVKVTKEDIEVKVENHSEEKVIVTTPSGSQEIKNEENTAGDSINNGAGSIGGGSSTGGTDGPEDSEKKDTYEVSDITFNVSEISVREEAIATIILKKNNSIISGGAIDINKVKIGVNDNISYDNLVLDEKGNVTFNIMGLKSGEGKITVSYETSVAKETSLTVKEIRETMSIETLQDELNNADDTYVLSDVVWIENEEQLNIPKNKTLVITDIGNITVFKGGNINNQGKIETRSTQKMRLSSDKNEIPSIDIKENGIMWIASGGAFRTTELEKIATEGQNAVICQVGGEMYVGEKKYVGSDDDALLKFPEVEEGYDIDQNNIWFSRNGDNKVCLIVYGTASISDNAKAGDLDCLLILKGHEWDDKRLGNLTIPNIDIIGKDGSIGAESGSTLTIGEQTYFTTMASPVSASAIFVETEGSIPDTNKGVGIFRNEDGRIFLSICGEITMNYACPNYVIIPDNRMGVTGTLKLNINSDEEQMEIGKGWIVKKENYHSTFVYGEDGEWVLQS